MLSTKSHSPPSTSVTAPSRISTPMRSTSPWRARTALGVNFPLTDLHPNAGAAAEFAMCAAKADHFWPIHDLLFQYQSKWAPLKDPAPFLLTLADSAGAPRDSIVSCLQKQETRALIQSEANSAARSGVSSTPTVFLEGAGLLKGAAPLETYRQILDSLWKVRTGAKVDSQ